MDAGDIRCGIEYDLLGHGQSLSRLRRQRTAAGDDLYTSCLLALDPDTGKLKWYFQYSPHNLRTTTMPVADAGAG